MSFYYEKSAYRVKPSTHTKNYISKNNKRPYQWLFLYIRKVLLNIKNKNMFMFKDKSKTKIRQLSPFLKYK